MYQILIFLRGIFKVLQSFKVFDPCFKVLFFKV